MRYCAHFYVEYSCLWSICLFNAKVFQQTVVKMWFISVMFLITMSKRKDTSVDITKAGIKGDSTSSEEVYVKVILYEGDSTSMKPLSI